MQTAVAYDPSPQVLAGDCLSLSPTQLSLLQVAVAGNPPSMYASLDALLLAGTQSCSPAALLNTMRMLFSLKADVLESNQRLAGLSSAQCCAILLLYNSSLMRFALTLRSPQLLNLAVQVPPEACPQLRLVVILL